MAINIPAKVTITAETKGGSSIDSLRQSIGQLNQSTSGIEKNFKSAASGLKSFVQLYVLDKGVQFVKNIIDLGEQLGNLSQITGVSTSTLSALKNAAELSNVSFEQLQTGLKKFSVGLSQAQSGSEKQADAFKAIGLQAGNLKNVDQALFGVADAFKNMKDGQDKARLAVDLFGKQGASLIPLLNEGSVAIKKFGLDLSGDFVGKAKLFNDSLRLMGIQFENIAIRGLGQLLPTMIDLVSVFSTLKKDPANFDWIDVMKEGLKDLALGAITTKFAFIELGDVFLGVGRKAANFLSTAREAINAGLSGDFDVAKAELDAFGEAAGKQDAILQKRLDTRLRDYAKTIQDIALAGTKKINVPKGLGGVNDADISQTDAREKAGIKFAQDKIRLINAETEALGLNEVEKKKLVLAAELEQHGLEQTNKLYDQYIEKINKAIDDQEKLKEKPELGAKKALEDYLEQTRNFSDLTKNAVSSSLKSLEDTFVDFFKTGKLQWRQFADAVITEMIRISVKRAIIAPIAGAILGAFAPGAGGASSPAVGAPTGGFSLGVDTSLNFANGGIMSAKGRLPLNKYARGGVANSPQMAVFGEGSMNEAYVPLPDGRSIPVSMRGGKSGGGGDTFNITINSGEGGATGDSKKGNAMAEIISNVVKSEIIRQKRPGGVLAS